MRLPSLLLALLCLAPLTATAQEPTVEAMQDYMMFSEYEAGIILPQQIDQQVFETALFIDTRSADQFAANHIPGAVNIEWRQVLERIDEIPSDRMTILYCNTGSLSAQESGGVAGLEEIVVTARKRVESIQDAPLTIQAFSEKQIEERGAQSLADLAKFTPGLTFNQGSSRAASDFSIRGMTQISDRTILFAARNQSLSRTVEESHLQSRIFFADRGIHDVHRIKLACNQHATILKALEQHDGQAASEAMREHIRAALEFTLGHMESQGEI